MKGLKYLTVVLFAAASVAMAGAFSFVPMSVSMPPSGSGSVVSFKVTNDSSQSIAVVISVMTRSMDQDGKETNGPTGKEFTVFPTRVVVQPNSFQTVKIQYRGTPSLSREACYRVIAEQVPIDFSKQETSGVKVLFRYIAALYVTPPKVLAKIEVESAVGAEKDGVKGIAVVLKNSGTRHALMSEATLKIQETASSLPLSLTGQAVQAFEGQNILPLTTRAFFVPYEAAIVGTAYLASYEATIE